MSRKGLPGLQLPGTRPMKGRPAQESKRILPSGHESWRHWSAKLIDAFIDRGTMTFFDVFAWGRQRGKSQDFCRHLLAYTDDRITLIPGKVWCLTTRAKRLEGERKAAVGE